MRARVSLDRASAGPAHHRAVELGRPVPLGELTQSLEALKLRLAGLEADAVTSEDAEAMAREISAIRLQLKRLRLDQAAMLDAVRRLDD